MQITMGKVDGKPFDVDTEHLRRSHLLITGVSGSGKSYRLRVLAETLQPLMPVFVFDPEGEYFTLRDKFPFMLFGDGGDAPMAVSTAGLTARKMLEWKRSAIFDLSSLDVDGQHVWMRDFLNSLMSAPHELWGPVACLIDEAHLFAPEKGEAQSVALGAMKNLSARGRKRGYFVVLATQRLSKLANNCASELQNFLVGRTTLQADCDRSAKTLGVDRAAEKSQFFREIKTLKDHQFFAQGIALSADRILVGPIEAKTRHVRPGDLKAVMPATPEEIKAFLPQLSGLVKEAKDQASASEDLQRRVHELTAELATLRAGKPAEDTRELRAELANTRAELENLRQEYERRADRMRRIYQLATGEADDKAQMSATPVFAAFGDAKLAALEPETPSINSHGTAAPAEEKGDARENAKRRILQALRLAEASRIPYLTRTWLAVIARFSATSSSYGGDLSDLVKAGLIEFPATGHVSLTEAGRAQTTRPPRPLRTADLLEMLQRAYEPGRYRILAALAAAGGKWMKREALAAAADQSPTSSAFGGHISKLRKLGLVEIGPQGVRVDQFIFLRDEVTA